MYDLLLYNENVNEDISPKEYKDNVEKALLAAKKANYQNMYNNNNVIEVFNSFPLDVRIIKYYGEEIFKKQSFKDYLTYVDFTNLNGKFFRNCAPKMDEALLIRREKYIVDLFNGSDLSKYKIELNEPSIKIYEKYKKHKPQYDSLVELFKLIRTTTEGLVNPVNKEKMFTDLTNICGTEVEIIFISSFLDKMSDNAKLIASRNNMLNESIIKKGKEVGKKVGNEVKIGADKGGKLVKNGLDGAKEKIDLVRRIGKSLDERARHMREDFKEKEKLENREAYIRGTISFSRELRRIIKYASINILAPHVGTMLYFVSIARTLKLSSREKAKIIDELKLHQELLDDRIDEANNNNDIKAKTALKVEKMKIQQTINQMQGNL